MNLWIIIATLFIGFLVLCVSVNWIVERKSREQERKKQQDRKWLQQHGKHIVAYVLEVQTGQDWKYEDRPQWNE